MEQCDPALQALQTRLALYYKQDERRLQALQARLALYYKQDERRSVTSDLQRISLQTHNSCVYSAPGSGSGVTNASQGLGWLGVINTWLPCRKAVLQVLQGIAGRGRLLAFRGV
jgi:hypothetical protein